MSETLRRELEAMPSEQDAITIAPVTQDEECELFSRWAKEDAHDRAVLQRRIEFRERLRTSAMPKFNHSPLPEDDLLAKDELPLFTKNSIGKEEVRAARRTTFFWNALRPAQRLRLCRALSLIYLDGFSNATCQELKASLYHGAVLRAGLWNGMLLLLARYPVRELLLRWRQYSQVNSLDALKIEIESKG